MDPLSDNPTYLPIKMKVSLNFERNLSNSLYFSYIFTHSVIILQVYVPDSTLYDDNRANEKLKRIDLTLCEIFLCSQLVNIKLKANVSET
jgi:hypothetical protein